jgi:hypothetical protein
MLRHQPQPRWPLCTELTNWLCLRYRELVPLGSSGNTIGSLSFIVQTMKELRFGLVRWPILPDPLIEAPSYPEVPWGRKV